MMSGFYLDDILTNSKELICRSLCYPNPRAYLYWKEKEAQTDLWFVFDFTFHASKRTGVCVFNITIFSVTLS